MRGIGAFLAMLSFGVGFRAQNQPPIPEDTATMIYSAAISQASLSGIKQFLIVADTTPQADVACPNSIISESEFGKRLAESRSEGQRAPRYDFGDAVPDADYDSYVEARQDYLRANQTSDLLPSRLDLPQTYRLISKDEASNLIDDTNVPYGQSIFWASAIGFSKDRSLALIYIERRETDSWGHDSCLYAFTKTRDMRWRLVQTLCHYRS